MEKSMNYYKDSTGKVFAYETKQDRDRFGAADLIPMTADDVDAHINPPQLPPTRDEVESARLAAYAHPVTGSDRYFAEAARLQAMGGTSEEIDAARTAGAARYADIQAEFPWP